MFLLFFSRGLLLEEDAIAHSILCMDVYDISDADDDDITTRRCPAR
jgi:hypothetical protein